MPAEESTAAIVIRARDYAESDRIVTLLTRDFGKLSGIAKGAKASRKRFERKLEPFSHVTLYFRRRPHGQLVFITRAEASEDLASFAIEDDLVKIALGSYMLELSDAFTSEEADAAGAYKLLSAALHAMNDRDANVALRQAFELRLLNWAGYGIDFSRCRNCGADTQVNYAFFVVTRGGVVCPRCRVQAPEGAVKLEGSSAAALTRLSRTDLADACAAGAAAGDGSLAISRFIASILDRRLRSAAFLDSVLYGNGSS